MTKPPVKVGLIGSQFISPIHAQSLKHCPQAEIAAVASPRLLKQSEKHDGPHASHFWDVERSGGGVTMDMGCHAIEFFRWMLGRPAIKTVYAQMSTQVHADKTRGEDNALLILEFENGVVAVAE